MVGSLMDATRDIDADLWRRALDIALAGLRHAELHEPPPGEDVIERLFKADRKRVHP